MTTSRGPDPETLVLRRGAHATRCEGVCLLEAVAWGAGEPHGDDPVCVSAVLAAFGRTWNDGMRSDAERAQLTPYVALCAGTGGDPRADVRRRWMAGEWMVRRCAPAWLRAAGLREEASALDRGPAIRDAGRAAAVLPAIRAARVTAGRVAVARGRTRGGGRLAGVVGAAAGAGGADAARVAATVVGRAGTREPGAAGRRAIVEMTWAAEELADWAAALVADTAAAWAGAGAGAVSRGFALAEEEAARDALEPTVRELQAAAHRLFREMIAARP